MKPLTLHLKNCRTYSDLVLDIPEGLVALLGENGAGKTTIVDAIDIALFGPESRTLADWYPRGAVSDDPLVIELVFEHGGDTYRVRRSYSPKGRGVSKLDLERQDEELTDGLVFSHEERWRPTWTPLTVESQSATQDQIQEIIGLSRATFRASSFLAQGQAGVFCEAPARQRKAILADALGLSEWDTLLERARGARRQADSDLDRIDGSLDRDRAAIAEKSLIEQEHAEARARETAARASLEKTRGELTTATETLAAVRAKVQGRLHAQNASDAAAQALRDLNSGIAEREAEVARLVEAQDQREEAETKAGMLAELQAEREALNAASAQWKERLRLEQEVRTLDEQHLYELGRIKTLTDRADHVLTDSEQQRCDRCQQVLNADAAQRAAESYRLEAAGILEQADTIVANVRMRRGMIEELPTEEPDLARSLALSSLLQGALTARETLSRLAAMRMRQTDAERELERLRAELPGRERDAAASLASLEELGPPNPYEDMVAASEVARLERKVAALTDTVQEALRDATQSDTLLKQIAATEERIAETEKRRDTVAQDAELYTNMERACGPNGVPALILDSIAIPQIETEATRILSLLGGPAHAVELHTQREKKTGGLADTLEIVLLTATGVASYESFSGGERARVAFALRLALAQLLASRKGSDTGLLVIDEIDGLDAQGVAALVDVLEGLGERIRTILIVSHDAQLRDSFENALVVEQVDGRSRIAEGVPA